MSGVQRCEPSSRSEIEPGGLGMEMTLIRIGGLGLGRSSAQIRNWVVLSTWFCQGSRQT